MISIIVLEMSNIEWGQIDPKGNRRVKKAEQLKSRATKRGTRQAEARLRGEF